MHFYCIWLFTLFRLFLSQLLYFILYYRRLCWFNFLNRYDIEENMSIMKQLELFFSLGLLTPFLSFLLFFFFLFLNSYRILTVSAEVCVIAAAAAKLLQSCLSLCDPIDGSPPGSLVPGILQARTLEWVAISFSNA